MDSRKGLERRLIRQKLSHDLVSNALFLFFEIRFRSRAVLENVEKRQVENVYGVMTVRRSQLESKKLSQIVELGLVQMGTCSDF